MANPQKFFAALEQLDRAVASARAQTQDDFALVPTPIKENPMFRPGGILAPPMADPTRPPRRTDGPRLKVRAVDGVHLHSLPAADTRNMLGRRARLFVAEWEIWLIDADGQEHMLEHHGTGAGALASLQRLLIQVGLLDGTGARPSVEGGVSDAA